MKRGKQVFSLMFIVAIGIMLIFLKSNFTSTGNVIIPNMCTNAGYTCIDSMTEDAEFRCNQEGMDYPNIPSYDTECGSGRYCCVPLCEDIPTYQCVEFSDTGTDEQICQSRNVYLHWAGDNYLDRTCGNEEHFSCCKIETGDPENTCEEVLGYTCGRQSSDGYEHSCSQLGDNYERYFIGDNYQQKLLDDGCGASFTACCKEKTLPQNGICGGANGNTFSSQAGLINSGLCSTGQNNTVKFNETTLKWEWTCSGTNGGNLINCEANKGEDNPDNGGSSTGLNTYNVDREEFEYGFVKRLKEEERFRFKIEDKYHYLEVLSITSNTVKIEVRSTVQTAILKEGDIRKFELTGDGYYDLKVIIRDISEDDARIDIQEIFEKITSQQQSEQKTTQTTAKKQSSTDLKETGEEDSNEGLWVYLVVIIAISIIFIGLLLYLAYRKKY